MDDLGKRDYADVVDTAIARLQTGLHLDLFPARREFVTTICGDRIKPTLVQCIMDVVIT